MDFDKRTSYDPNLLVVSDTFSASGAGTVASAATVLDMAASKNAPLVLNLNASTSGASSFVIAVQSCDDIAFGSGQVFTEKSFSLPAAANSPNVQQYGFCPTGRYVRVYVTKTSGAAQVLLGWLAPGW